MTNTELRARWWTYRRLRLGHAASSLETALQDIAGAYSSHPSAPLSLWARVMLFSPDDFRALEQERRVLRLPVMRGSSFLMLAEDGARAFAAIPRRGFDQYIPLLRYANIAVEDFPQLRERLLSAATEPLTPKQIREASGEAEGRIMTVARILAYEGELLRIGADSLRSNSLKYVNSSVWCPGIFDGHDPDESLQWLAGRYLTAFGPARVKDFQWWAGVKPAQAKDAIAALDTVTLPDDMLLTAEDLAEFERVTPPPDDAIDILPKWDSYTMGYPVDGRARFLAPEMNARVYTNVGDGLGMVLVGGAAVATWHHSFSGKRMDVILDVFDAAAKPHLEAIHARFEEVAAVLGGASCEITAAESPLAPSLGFSRRRKTDEA